MARANKPEDDLQECFQQVEALLEKYNCKIEFDEELDAVIIWDIDTKRYNVIQADNA